MTDVVDWLKANTAALHAALDRKGAALDAKIWLQDIRIGMAGRE